VIDMNFRFNVVMSLGLLAFTSAAAQAAQKSPVQLQVNLAQTFAPTTCPADAPTGSFCLNVTGTGTAGDLGKIEMTRIVRLNGAAFTPKQPNCVEGFTRGKMTFTNTDSISFDAFGQICLANGIAGYHLVVTGGTGRYKGAVGGGTVTVPPPSSGSTGRELWTAVIYIPEGR